MRTRTIAAMLAGVALSTGLTLGLAVEVATSAITAAAARVDVGYDNGHLGIDVAGRWAADITRDGGKVGPAARTEDDPHEGNPRMVWACAVHGNRQCGNR